MSAAITLKNPDRAVPARAAASVSEVITPPPNGDRRAGSAGEETLRLALAFARILLEQHPRGPGIRSSEIAERLEISVARVHRLIRAAELAGWPLEHLTRSKNDAETRWRMIR